MPLDPPSTATETIVAGPVRLTGRRSELRAGLRLLGRALVGYGIAGLVLGGLGLLLALTLLLRFADATGSLVPRLTALGDSIDAIATAMDDAAATSRTAAATIETTTPAVEGLAATVEATGPTLGRMGATLESFSLLGARPLAEAGSRFRELSDDLRDLGPQLRGLSSGLRPNAVTLRGTAGSFERVADELRAAARVVGGVTIGTLAALVALLVLALLAWVVAPAVGAIVLGRRILGWVGPSVRPRPERERGRTPDGPPSSPESDETL